MGNFVGHVVPGVIFVLLGIVMHNDSMHDYFQKVSSGGTYESRLFYTVRQCKITLAGIVLASLAELGTGFNWNHFLGSHIHDPASANTSDIKIGHGITNSSDGSNTFRSETYHHISMYASGIPVTVISLMYLKSKLNFFPQGLDHLLFSFGAFNAAFMFAFHTMGIDVLESVLHILILLSFAMIFTSGLLHLVFRESVFVTLYRCFSMILTGSFCIQTAFILYPPLEPRRDNCNSNLMMIPVVYSVHMFAILTYLFGRTYLVAMKVRRESCPNMDGEQKYNYLRYRTMK